MIDDTVEFSLLPNFAIIELGNTFITTPTDANHHTIMMYPFHSQLHFYHWSNNVSHLKHFPLTP